MRSQIWCYENIENVLWAAQTMGQASAIVVTAINGNTQTPYAQGFQFGLESVFNEMKRGFQTATTTHKIWSGDQIRNLLLTIQTLDFPQTTLLSGQMLAAYQDGLAKGGEVALWCTATAFGVSLWPSSTRAVLPQSMAENRAQKPWFYEDIKNILFGLDTIRQVMHRRGQGNNVADRVEGFNVALHHIGQTFGIRLLPTAGTAASNDATAWSRLTIEHKLALVQRMIPTHINIRHSPTKRGDYWYGFSIGFKGAAIAFGMQKLNRRRTVWLT